MTILPIVNTQQVMFAMRELSGALSLLIEMVTYSSFCNEPFSLGVLQLLKVRISEKQLNHIYSTISMH